MKKIYVLLLLSVLLLVSSCESKHIEKNNGLSISGITTSLGAYEKNSDNNEIQSFKYTITLTNNDDENISLHSVTPILSEKFLSLVIDKDVTLEVNKIIEKSGILNLSGEIVFNTKGLEKQDILNLQPFVKEVKITEERIIQKTF